MVKIINFFYQKLGLAALSTLFFIFLTIIGLTSGIQAEETENVTVFVLDSKVNYNFVEHKSLDIGQNVSHGSIVAHIIKEEAPEVQIISYSVENSNEIMEESLYFSALKKIAYYKTNNPRQRILVNISLAFPDYNREHYQLIKSLHRDGIEIFAAAGNDNSQRPIYPAGFNEVVAVANADASGKTSSSNYGNYIDVSAPGNVEYISRIYFPGRTMYKKLKTGGTSFSAPRVTGLMADLLSRQPDLTSREAVEIIMETAVPINDKKYRKGMLGAGVINKTQALKKVDPYYQIKQFLHNLLLPLILAIIIFILLLKTGFTGVFIFLLLTLVVFPLMLVTGYQFKSLLFWLGKIKLNWVNSSILIAGFIFLLIATGWSKLFLITLYSGLIFSIIFLLNYTNINPSMIRLLFCIFPLVLYSIEKVLLLHIKNNRNNYQLLISYLGSHSKKIVLRAQRLLAKSKSDITGLLLQHLRAADKKKKIISLLQLLMEFENPPLNLLLSYTADNKLYFDTIKDSLQEKQGKMMENKIIPGLIRLLQSGEAAKRERAAEILADLRTKMVIEKLHSQLKNPQGINRITILNILAAHGENTRELMSDIKNIIVTEDDMWLRYYALKTLFAIHPQPGRLLPLLANLSEDTQELVRLEARGLLKDLNE